MFDSLIFNDCSLQLLFLTLEADFEKFKVLSVILKLGLLINQL